MVFVLIGLACAPRPEPIDPPRVRWLAPDEGDTVSAGDVAGSVIVDAFTMADPARHNSGVPIGYLRVTVDDAEALTTGATTFTLHLEPGVHTLAAALYYADGDAVWAAPDALCAEADTGCAPAEASIGITAE